MSEAIKLQTDKPLPALLTVGEAAVVLRGEDTPANRKFILRLVDSKALRKGYGGKKKGSNIYIKAESIRQIAC